MEFRWEIRKKSQWVFNQKEKKMLQDKAKLKKRSLNSMLHLTPLGWVMEWSQLMSCWVFFIIYFRLKFPSELVSFPVLPVAPLVLCCGIPIHAIISNDAFELFHRRLTGAHISPGARSCGAPPNFQTWFLH